MYGYDVHEALYLNCKILCPWVRDSDPWAGPIRIYRKMYLDFKILLYFHSRGD